MQDVEGVLNVHLYMDEDSTLRLIESVTFKEETHCLYEEDGHIYNASINVRGNISVAWDKKSFAISVERADGIQEYAFDASYFDPSSIRNNVALYSYREMGLPAPQTENTALFLNGTYLGFYTRVDIYREDHLQEFYGTERIELFKCGFRPPGLQLPIQDISEKKIPRDDDFAALAVLFTQVRSLSDAEWNDWSAENFDVEQTARYLAIHNFLGVYDTTVKNFYVGLHDGKYFLLPLDNESSFSDYYPIAGSGILPARLLAPGTATRDEYDRVMDEYFFQDSQFVAGIIGRVTELYTEIELAVLHDTNRFWSFEEFLSNREFLLDYLNARTDRIRP